MSTGILYCVFLFVFLLRNHLACSLFLDGNDSQTHRRRDAAFKMVIFLFFVKWCVVVNCFVFMEFLKI